MKELIEQIGGRERLEKIASWSTQSWSTQFGRGPNIVLPVSEAEAMARALLAVLDAKPLGYIDPESMREYRGVMAGGSWSATPRTGEYNQTMPVYTNPPAASLPDGWKLVAYTDAEEMRLLRGGTSAYMFNCDYFDIADRIALYAISPAQEVNNV